jgi:lysophospholipid acyltransferase (LPLAT)-like uncharacterized protein
MIAGYGYSVTKNARVLWEGRENIPSGPTIWFTFHDTNLVALAMHDRVSPRRVQAFVPPGLVGLGMRGWFDGVGFESLPLPAEGTGNPMAALKTMARGLSHDGDVVIAVDGPHGPARSVKPGAFWLGRLTGYPMLTVGFAAKPSIRFPRWDHHLVPLPGASIAVVFSEPVHVDRRQELDEPFLASMGGMIEAVTKRAREIL